MPDFVYGCGLELHGRDGRVAASANVGGMSFVCASEVGEVHLGMSLDGDAFHMRLSTQSAREFGAALVTAAALRDAADRAKGVTK